MSGALLAISPVPVKFGRFRQHSVKLPTQKDSFKFSNVSATLSSIAMTFRKKFGSQAVQENCGIAEKNNRKKNMKTNATEAQQKYIRNTLTNLINPF